MTAKALASVATAEVGTVLYSEAAKVLDLAVVLGPEVPLRRAGQMLYALMIGVGDAIGALAPPEVVVTYQLPWICPSQSWSGRRCLDRG